MEVVEAHAVVRKRVDIRRIDQGTEAPDLGEADVVEQEDDDVGCILVGELIFRPPLLRVAIAFGDDAAEALDLFRLDPILGVAYFGEIIITCILILFRLNSYYAKRAKTHYKYCQKP